MNKIAKHLIELRKQYEGKPCEACGKQHDHSYGSGRFCSRSCRCAYRKTKGASLRLKAHLDKLRASGRAPQKAPYGTWKCKICNQVCETRRELQQHYRHDHMQPQLSVGLSLIGHESQYVCPYCGKSYTKRQSCAGHIASCKQHPFKDFHDSAHKRAGDTQKQCYASGKYGFSHKGFAKGSHHTLETKERISVKRAEQVRNEYLTNFHAKVKWYKVRNVRDEEFNVRGHWEENIALQLNKLGIYWTKSQPLKYFDEYWHNYTPDFYVPDLDVCVEVKGRYPDTDKKKMKLVIEQHPDKKIYFIHDRYHDFISGKCAFDDSLLISAKDL